MEFLKMHGLGNDFIVLEGAHALAVDDPAALAVRLCAAHTGIGADGLVLILPSETADARMRIFNLDGSEAEMCGNAIRCVGKRLYETGIVREPKCTIETLGGLKTLALTVNEVHEVVSVTVDMGLPKFDPEEVPMMEATNTVRVQLGKVCTFYGVSMGNPHAVTFDCFPEDGQTLRSYGSIMEGYYTFIQHTNVEFVKVLAPDHVKVQVWERGAGATLACGTGACAVLAAGASQGLLPRRAPIRLPGGTLLVRWDEGGHLFMTGPAETVFTGEVAL